MRKWIKIVIWTLLLAAGVTVCVVRWQAWFGMPDEPVWTGDSLTYVFPTFNQRRVPGFVAASNGWQDTIAPESLDILVLGDIHNRLQRSDYDTLAARVPQADAVAQVGDWIDRGQEYYHQLLLREWTNSNLCGLPVINCPGNHDYTKGIDKHLPEAWHTWFPQPLNAPALPGVFYYVDFAQVRFIVMDTNPLDPLVYRTRALTWLLAAMKGAGNRNIVVMMHHPVVSVAKGRFNPGIYATFRYALRDADLVITGHEHSYMRQMPFVIVNSAGREKPQKVSERFEFASSEPVYSVLSFERDTTATHSGRTPFSFRTYRMSDGVLIDSVYVDHH